MNNDIALASMAMDLKRAALGAHRGSTGTAETFMQESVKRRSEIEESRLPDYMKTVVKKINMEIDPEDALMYSTIIQNYVLHK